MLKDFPWESEWINFSLYKAIPRVLYKNSGVSVDLNTRANFYDFLRDVGLAARYEHDHSGEVDVVA